MQILYHHRTQGEEPESIHINSIVLALRDRGHEVAVIGPAGIGASGRAAGRPSLLGRVKRAVPGAVFELLQIAYNLVAYRRLSRACRDLQPDLIYERYALFSAAGVLVAKRRGIPLILEVNTPYAQAWAKYYGLHLQRLARWLERRILLAADHIVTVTYVQKRLLQALGVPAQRITVSHNAIEPRSFAAVPDEATRIRDELALSGVVVGFVGTMNRWQGIPQFREVVSSVLERCANVNFLFVGDGEFRAPLEAFCRERGFLDRVRFAGRKAHSEIPGLVAAMDITVLLNSNDHGSPMKIFEYWGMGKAVVAPAVEPVLEVLQVDVTGLLIEPGNAAQMADRIVLLASDVDLRRRLGEAGRAHVMAHHTWGNNAAQILAAHAGLVGSPAGTSQPNVGPAA